MKILLLSVIALLASANAKAADIYGSWDLAPQSSGGITFKMNMLIEPAKLTMTGTCVYPDGASITSTASGRIEVTADAVTVVEVLGGNDGSTSSHSCNMSVTLGTVNYLLAGDNDAIFKAEGQSILASRRQ